MICKEIINANPKNISSAGGLVCRKLWKAAEVKRTPVIPMSVKMGIADQILGADSFAKPWRKIDLKPNTIFTIMSSREILPKKIDKTMAKAESSGDLVIAAGAARPTETIMKAMLEIICPK